MGQWRLSSSSRGALVAMSDCLCRRSHLEHQGRLWLSRLHCRLLLFHLLSPWQMSGCKLSCALMMPHRQHTDARYSAFIIASSVWAIVRRILSSQDWIPFLSYHLASSTLAPRLDGRASLPHVVSRRAPRPTPFHWLSPLLRLYSIISSPDPFIN